MIDGAGLNRNHIIKADLRTLKPMSLWPWEEIDDDTDCKRGIWTWSELINWNQHGKVITLDLPQIGRVEFKSKYANEIAVHLETWKTMSGSQKRRIVAVAEASGSESDTLGSWESIEDTKPAHMIIKTTPLVHLKRRLGESSSEDSTKQEISQDFVVLPTPASVSEECAIDVLESFV